ncbi:hypothetical protein [Duganella vulcania]|uniref:Uncharacterized protein n=1 Tax=Duganella vulcania TaxID=2692166 RepID=A0A845GJ48_9BURK|nr:hypothetical protein [Duganella vulcania]MYM92679.1 hypothetical protein [Duganella vulcania]
MGILNGVEQLPDDEGESVPNDGSDAPAGGSSSPHPKWEAGVQGYQTTRDGSGGTTSSGDDADTSKGNKGNGST